jgi:hypothetical protein
MKIYKVQIEEAGPQTVICKSVDETFDHIRIALQEEERGHVTIEIAEMSEADVIALPEFDGY